MKLIKDITFGCRSLASKPTYSIIALLTLMLGIGVTTTMFSLVNSILLQPLPLVEPQQLVELTYKNKAVTNSSFSFKGYESIRDTDTPLQSVTFGAYDQGVVQMGEVYNPFNLIITTYDYFGVFKTPAMLGRTYDKTDAGKNVVVLSYTAWVKDFDKRPDIVGQTIIMNKDVYSIIGVMPAGFSDLGNDYTEIWSLITDLKRPGFVFGRLKDGISLGAAQTQTAAINRILNQNNDSTDGDWQASFGSLKDRTVRDIKEPLMLLSLAVVAVFIIALLNLLNLSFAHYGNRLHEFSVRVSLGATRGRLVRQLLTESGILSLLGGALGLLLAAWSLELIKVMGEASMPRIQEIGLDVFSVSMTLLLVIAATLVTALLPAFVLVNPNKLNQSLQDASTKSTGSRTSQQIRRWLVAAEVSAAVVLLIGAGLLLRSYVNLIQVDPGFNSSSIVTGHIWLPDNFGNKQQQTQHWQTLLEEMQADPDVLNIAATSTLPMMTVGIDFDVVYSFDEAIQGQGMTTRGATRSVSNAYFDTLDIPIIDGRVFDIQDQLDSLPVVVINQALADTLWKTGSPVGRQLILPEWMGGLRTIIGVVGNVKHNGLRDEAEPEFFLPMLQNNYVGMSLVAKVREGQAGEVLKSMSQLASKLDSSAPLIIPSTMDELMSKSVDEEKVILQLISVFSVLAVALASIGVYGVSDNMVNQRTNEIGVRMALGAQPKIILRWVLLQSLRPVIYGAIAGIALAVALVQLLTALLYDVSSLDPITYLFVPSILLLVGCLATWLPARRATRIHPQQALHYQ